MHTFVIAALASAGLAVASPGPAAAAGPFTDVSAGAAHSCAIRSGTVWCWGLNDSGQLGTQTPSDNAVSPVQVDGITDAVEVAAGGDHTCARLSTGTVKCWGANNLGQLGNGKTKDSTTPVTVDTSSFGGFPLTGVTGITAGRAHTCAMSTIRSGTVWCWGANGFGQLGTADGLDIAVGDGCLGFCSGHQAAKVATDTNGFTFLATLVNSQLSVFELDHVGGYLASYDVPAVSNGGSFFAPVAIAVHGDIAHFEPVYVGVAWPGERAKIHVFARSGGANPTERQSLSADPDVCPAQDGCRLLGLATDADGNVYAAVDVSQVPNPFTAGHFEVTKLDQFGNLVWRIDDTSGEFGGGVNEIRDIAIGRDVQGHELLYVLDGTMSAGRQAFVHVYDTNGGFLRRMFVGDPTGACVVPGVDPSSVQPRGIGTASNGTVAVSMEQGVFDGNISGTRWNLSCTELRSPTGAFLGSFGGEPDFVPAPGLVQDTAGTPDGELIAAQMLPGGARKVDLDGVRDRSWGRRQFASTATEVRSLSDLSDHGAIVAVGAGARHTCAIVEPSNVPRSAWCWGANGANQLGTASDSPVSTSFPTKPRSFVNNHIPTAIAAGADHTCLVRFAVSDGGRCFGENAQGQLRTPAGSGGPTMFDTFGGFTLVAAGANFTCLAGTARVSCRGDDTDGQLGDGSAGCLNNTALLVVTESCPATDGASVLSGILRVDGGNRHACAVADDGDSVWCWGGNDEHQVSHLGDTTFDHAVEVLFPATPGGGPPVTIELVGYPDTNSDEVPLNGPMWVTFNPAVTNVDPANLLIGPEGSGTTIAGYMECYDLNDATNGGCPPGPPGLVTKVLFTPNNPLTPGVEYEARVNPPGAPLMLVGGEPVAPTTTETVHVHLGPAVDLSLDVGPVGTPAYPNGVFLVGYSDQLAAVTADNTIVTLHGSTTPIAGSSTCLDQAAQTVDCTTGPVDAVRIVPDDPLDPGAEFDAYLNPAGLPPATLGGEAVPLATAGPVALGESAAVGLTLSGPNDASITSPDGPFVVHFSDPITNVSGDNVVVTPEGTTIPVVGNQACFSPTDEAVVCGSGDPVGRLEFSPDLTLAGGSTYTATLNPPGATPALRDGFRPPEATSNPLSVEDAAVFLTLSGPEGETTLRLHGPMKVTFSKVITSVTTGNLVFEAQGTSTQVTGSLECRDASDAVVSCATGDVSAALLTPDNPLVPGETYAATLNPPGSTPAKFHNIDIPEATSNTAQVGVGDPVPITLSGPNGAPEIPLEGPFVVTLSTPLTEITQANVFVTQAGAPGPVAGSMECKDESAAVVDCFTGPVKSVEITPDDILVPGTLFSATLDPAGAPPALEDGYPTPTATDGPIHALTNLDQTSAAIHYTWGTVFKDPAFGGKFVAEEARFARARFSFTGYRVQLFTVDGPDRGLAAVRIDGALVDQIDGSTPTVKYGVLHNYGGLVDGPHTITVTTLSGKGDTVSVGRLVAVDGFRVFTATGATLTDNPDMDYQLGRRPSGKATFGAYANSRRPGASASIKFRGTAITWHTFVGPRMGGARVFLDGDLKGTFDNRAPAQATKKRFFGGLVDGLHTLRIVVAGGGTVALDGFLVKGST